MSSPRIEVVIQEVVRPGLELDDVPAFRDAVRAGLAGLAARHPRPGPPREPAQPRSTVHFGPADRGPGPDVDAELARSIWAVASTGRHR